MSIEHGGPSSENMGIQPEEREREGEGAQEANLELGGLFDSDALRFEPINVRVDSSGKIVEFMNDLKARAASKRGNSVIDDIREICSREGLSADYSYATDIDEDYGGEFALAEEDWGEAKTEGYVVVRKEGLNDLLRKKRIRIEDEIISFIEAEMTKEDALELLASSTSEEEWGANCDKIKNAFNGYPGWWFREVVLSKLESNMRKKWKK